MRAQRSRRFSVRIASRRNVTKGLEYGLLVTEIAGAAWEGGETRLGKTFWQTIDASAGSAIAAEAMKRIFSRERPSETDDPNQWFKGDHHRSFPSGEVTFASSVVGPFVLEHGREQPAVYALELLPLYEAVARVKQALADRRARRLGARNRVRRARSAAPDAADAECDAP